MLQTYFGAYNKKKKRMSFQACMSFFLMLNIEDILKGF